MRPFRGTLGFWTALLTLAWSCSLEVTPAFAGLAPSRVTGATAIASTRDADLVAVQRALEHRLVAQKLRDYGVRPAELQARLGSLSDQVILLASRLLLRWRTLEAHA